MASKGLGLSQNDLEKSIEAAPFLYTKRAAQDCNTILYGS